jgi:hypothetical protein
MGVATAAQNKLDCGGVLIVGGVYTVADFDTGVPLTHVRLPMVSDEWADTVLVPAVALLKVTLFPEAVPPPVSSHTTDPPKPDAVNTMLPPAQMFDGWERVGGCGGVLAAMAAVTPPVVVALHAPVPFKRTQ